MICDIEKIKQFGKAVFMKVGLSEEDAEICMNSFIESDLRGVKSHGVTRLKGYIDRIQQGSTTATEEMIFTETSPSTLTVDAKANVGMSAGLKVMNKCIEKAAKTGACFAAVKNACHYGFGGFFVMQAAKKDMIGFSVCNTPALVAPFGGALPMLGTNPLSIALPAGRHPTLVLDMATSVVAKGKIHLAMKEGKQIPDTWALDKDGNPTTDPAAANIGALLPFGGAKGYAIGLIIDVLCSCLSGAGTSREIPRVWEELDKVSNIGYFMGAIDISKFVEIDCFKNRVDTMFDEIKACPAAPGFSSVMLPGEIEYYKSLEGHRKGIDLPDAILNEFKELSQTFAVPYPFS